MKKVHSIIIGVFILASSFLICAASSASDAYEDNKERINTFKRSAAMSKGANFTLIVLD